MFFKQCVCVAIVAIGLSMAPMSAQAQDIKFDINIATTDAATALNLLSRQTDYPLLFNYEDIKSLRVNSLDGNHTLNEALELMFQDTGFTGHLVNREVLSVSPVEISENHSEGKDMSLIDIKKSRSLLGGASAVALTALAAPAAAQDADQMEEMVVTGIRSSLNNALLEKREADSLVEIILAEDIGKLPDQNLAEVLENITGVQITRTAGVGTNVQIRGTDDNRVEINGVSTVGSGTGRSGIDFEDINASIIAGLEVIKSPEASTIEGSVGGTINLRTIRPLDLDETLASVRIQGENSNLSNSTSPRFSAAVGKSWENASGQEIGFVLSGSYTEQEATSFRPRVDRDNVVESITQQDATFRSAAQDFPFLGIQFLNQELENFEFETINVSGSIELKPTD